MMTCKRLPNGKWECGATFTDDAGEEQTLAFEADSQEEAERLAEAFLTEKGIPVRRIARDLDDKPRSGLLG